MKNLIFKTLLGGLIASMSFASIAHAEVMSDYTWDTVFTGYGAVDVNPSENYVWLEPAAATAEYDTHAALVVSEEQLTGNYEISVTMENIRQLRENTPPNPWEAPWFVFGYKDVINSNGDPDQTFTYLILKPDGYGLELGEALTYDDQTFLWTSTVGDESYDEGVEYDLVLRVEDGTITVTIDGDQKFVFADENNEQTLTWDGKFGFYTEDAEVEFSDLYVTDLNVVEPEPEPEPEDEPEEIEEEPVEEEEEEEEIIEEDVPAPAPPAPTPTPPAVNNNTPFAVAVPGAKRFYPYKDVYVKRAYNLPKKHEKYHTIGVTRNERRSQKQNLMRGQEFRRQSEQQRAMARFYANFGK